AWPPVISFATANSSSTSFARSRPSRTPRSPGRASGGRRGRPQRRRVLRRRGPGAKRLSAGIIEPMPHDHAERLARASRQAELAGLDAIVVAPGPDLMYLTGYGPPPLERLTALVVRPGTDPVLLVPTLERPR